MSALFRKEFDGRPRLRIFGSVKRTRQPVVASMSIVLVALSLGLLVSAALIDFKRTLHVKGIVVTENPSVRLMALRPGIVSATHVREGEVVHQGQILAQLRNEGRTESTSRTAAAPAGIAAIDASVALLTQQISQIKLKQSEETSKTLLAIAALKDEARSINLQIEVQERVAEASRKVAETYASLGEFASGPMVAERRRQQYLDEQRLMELGQAAIRTRGQIVSQEATARAARHSVALEILGLESRLSALRGERHELAADVSSDIVSPIDGRVAAAYLESGNRVTAERLLYVIEPMNPKFQLEVFVPSKGMERLRVGEDVRVAFDAYPVHEHGSAKAVVDRIPRIASKPQDIDAPFPIEEPVYRVRLSLPDLRLVNGERLNLLGGMTATAIVDLGGKDLRYALTAPLKAVVRAFQ